MEEYIVDGYKEPFKVNPKKKDKFLEWAEKNNKKFELKTPEKENVNTDLLLGVSTAPDYVAPSILGNQNGPVESADTGSTSSTETNLSHNQQTNTASTSESTSSELQSDDMFSNIPAKWKIDILEGTPKKVNSNIVGSDSTYETIAMDENLARTYFTSMDLNFPHLQVETIERHKLNLETSDGTNYNLLLKGHKDYNKEQSLEVISNIENFYKENKDNKGHIINSILGNANPLVLSKTGMSSENLWKDNWKTSKGGLNYKLFGPNKDLKGRNAVLNNIGYNIVPVFLPASANQGKYANHFELQDSDGNVVVEAGPSSGIQNYLYNNITTDQSNKLIEVANGAYQQRYKDNIINQTLVLFLSFGKQKLMLEPQGP